jgi:hypothetical protein
MRGAWLRKEGFLSRQEWPGGIFGGSFHFGVFYRRINFDAAGLGGSAGLL